MAVTFGAAAEARFALAGSRRKIVLPSFTVSTTLMSAMLVGATAVGSADRMAKSASLPGSRLPFVASS